MVSSGSIHAGKVLLGSSVGRMPGKVPMKVRLGWRAAASCSHASAATLSGSSEYGSVRGGLSRRAWTWGAHA